MTVSLATVAEGRNFSLSLFLNSLWTMPTGMRSKETLQSEAKQRSSSRGPRHCGMPFMLVLPNPTLMACTTSALSRCVGECTLGAISLPRESL